MKIILVFAAVVTAAQAQYQSYGAPFQPHAPIGLPQHHQQQQHSNGGGYQQNGNGGHQQPSNGGVEPHTPQVFRHVYVHVAPDEPEDRQARTIRVPGGDKHVNIIFVKTPSSSSSQQTEVILPEQDEQKNIVYVLVKKFDATTDLKIRAPRPTTPSKPEVYFIRYKNQNGGQNGGQDGGNNGGSSGAYGPPPSQPRPQYGAPF